MHYELEVDIAIPLPGLIKRRAAGMIMGTALKELKKAVETATSRSKTARRSSLAGLMRILLFTGKGGVGKTTVAAATAVRARACRGSAR